MVEFDPKKLIWFIFSTQSRQQSTHFYTSAIGIAPLGFPWYCSPHPDTRKKNPQLQIWPHHRSDTAFPPKCFFHVGEQKNSPVMPNQGNMHGDQQVTHISNCNHRLVWRSIVPGWWKRTPFVSFPGHFEISLVLLFKVLNYVSSVGLSGRKQCS